MIAKSFLAKYTVNTILTVAKQNLEKDHALEPVLFVRTIKDKVIVIPLALPDTAAERAKLFARKGREFCKDGAVPHEAILVCEGWFVAVQKVPAAMNFAPSEHPSRQEAIVAIGRNADNTRQTQVVQPFVWDKKNQPIWQAIPMESYNEKTPAGPSSAGLLDYFFAAGSEAA